MVGAYLEPTLPACAASRAECRGTIVMKHVRQNRPWVGSRSRKTRATQLFGRAEIRLDASHTTRPSRRGTGGVFFLDILSHRTREPIKPMAPHSFHPEVHQHDLRQE